MRSFLQTIAQGVRTQAGVIALALTVMPHNTVASPAPGGSFIRNVAEASYFNPTLGIVERVFSNPVEALVAKVPALEVTGYSDLLLSRGAMGQYFFEVTNVGNVPLSTRIAIENVEAAARTTNGTLVPDFNGNGRIDAEETGFDLSAPLPLIQGEGLPLIYEFRVSAETPAQTELSSVLRIVATADDGVVLAAEAEGISRVQNPALELEKEQRISEGVDALITYTLRLRNNAETPVAGYSAQDGVPILIDGAPASGVLLRDEIPLNTVFSAMEDNGGMMALVHLRRTPRHEYLSASSNVPAEDIDAVAFWSEGDFPVGRSTDPRFSVRVPEALGSVNVENTAETFVADAEEAIAVASNSVIYDRAGLTAGTLAFEDPATGDDQQFGAPGTDTRLRVTAGSCNISAAADSVTVTVRSTLTGDVETLIATETDANTGTFTTAPLPMVQMASAVSGDQVMATDFGDSFFASATCGGALLEDTLIINPGNFLFNSVTNAPVEGATVVLMNAATGTEVARTTTDQRGFFTFGDVPPGRYSYALVDAAAWVFPSVRRDNPGMGRAVNDAGFGTTFHHSGGALFVSDIPVDPFYGAPLSLQKAADRDTVGNGEFVIYSLNFTNNMHQALIGGEISDRPARGVTLVPGSVTLNGAALADPHRSPTGDLLFDVGLLEPLSSHELTYVMQFTAAAREGRSENTALLSGRQAGTGTLRQSQTARAVVRVDNSGGVFASQGTVLGAVFMDCNANGIQDEVSDEPGVPGVRIFTQEGLTVVTDIDGRYSLAGLRPVTHAFLVQPETMPVDTAVQITRTNDLMRGGSRVIPLKKGEMRAENFALAECSSAALEEVALRRAHFSEENQPLSMNAADLPIEARRSPVRSARSEAGIATTSQLTSGMIAEEIASAEAEALAEATEAAANRRPLEDMIRSLESALGFLDYEDGAAVTRQTQNIRVKGPADLTLSLMLNGQAIASDRVGERTRWQPNNVQALEYVAVNLAPGENILTIVGRDGFGIERAREELRLIAPGRPSRIEIVLPETAAANPASVVPVMVRVLDASGRLVPASGTVTLSARRALWEVTDIRTGTPGVQAYFDKGQGTFGLIPPQVSGPDVITVRGSFGVAEASITFTPNLEERVLIGVVEGAVSLDGSGAGTDGDRLSGFEDTTTGLRGELFLKGVVRGDALLTLRYSSDRNSEDQLFRDIRGDEYYPVYGDNSERGADAQSSSNLYVKVERGRSYALYGDIAIEPTASAFRLDGQRRVTTGVKSHWENDRLALTLFAAYTAQEQVVVEIAGRGVSGPYELDLDAYVQGSERVEILVRDAEGGDVLSVTPMRRGTDYLLDFFRDTITFDTPVRQADADGNPVSIRVTYETETDRAEKFWLYGGEVNYALGDATSVGARAVHADADRGNAARARSHSAFIRHDATNGGIWEVEAARSEDADGNTDTATRISYEIQSDNSRFSFNAINSGSNFQAQGGLARPGTSQVRLSYGRDLADDSAVGLGLEYTSDRANDSDRLTVDAAFSRAFDKNLRGEVGLELTRQTGASADDEAYLTVDTTWTPTDRPGTVIDAELRLPIAGEKPTELSLGMHREPEPGWRVYNEVVLEFSGITPLTRQTMGFSYELNEWLGGRTDINRTGPEEDTTMVQGVSLDIDLNEITSFSADFEHAMNLDLDESTMTSLALGMKWGHKDGSWVADADFDTTWEDSGNTYYGSLGAAGQVTPELTVLGRSRAAFDYRNGEEVRRMRTRAGAAYRPAGDDRAELLAWYEHRLEQKRNRTETHMWSLDAAYEADEDLRINGKYAGQHQEVEVAGTISTAAITQLLQAGLNYEFADDRFQLGANVSRLWDSEHNSANGLGLEFGFVPHDGLLLAAGYNWSSETVTGQSDLYQEGLYLRFNLLLDNSLWNQLDRFLGH